MSTIEIIEVSPRDGLQNEKLLVSTADKLELIRRAQAAGVRRMEAVSFANPKRVPQMADAEAVMQGVTRSEDEGYIGLLLNRRGLDRAIAAGCREVNYVICATDSFSTRNQAMTTAESLAAWLEVATAAKAAGIRASVTIAASFGCPFEGEVAAPHVLALAEKALAGDPCELAFADTIGCGAPNQVTDIVTQGTRLFPNIRLHFHNTRNTGLAKVGAAVAAGAKSIDSGIAGAGGCPFAPGATGNVATEDVVYMLERMGVKTGLDLPALVEAGRWLSTIIDRPNQSGVGRAGIFPRAAA
jgi:isopropylmalate/homocitrate/citramalate synthase